MNQRFLILLLAIFVGWMYMMHALDEIRREARLAYSHALSADQSAWETQMELETIACRVFKLEGRNPEACH